jgi:hypothetical protein
MALVVRKGVLQGVWVRNHCGIGPSGWLRPLTTVPDTTTVRAALRHARPGPAAAPAPRGPRAGRTPPPRRTRGRDRAARWRSGRAPRSRRPCRARGPRPAGRRGARRPCRRGPSSRRAARRNHGSCGRRLARPSTTLASPVLRWMGLVAKAWHLAH